MSVEREDGAPNVVLITGGTGSFGQAMTRFLLDHTNAIVRVLSRDIYKHQQMRQVFGIERVRYFLGDVRDFPRLLLACRGVDVVFHAAALKHVDVGEYNPTEFIATNITGTSNVAMACIERSVKKAIFLSSDKAIHAENLYGSTKATAAALWNHANAYDPQGCIFTTVRWANVSGSRGSVIPLWRAQLRHGVPPTLTSRQMSRFWITLDEAVQCAWFATQHGRRGATYVPYLPAYQVTDLLGAVCAEAGQADVTPAEIGVRPGEKLAELLMTDEELARAMMLADTQGPAQTLRYYCVPSVASSWEEAPMHILEGGCYFHPRGRLCEPPYQSDVWAWRLDQVELQRRLQEVP